LSQQHDRLAVADQRSESPIFHGRAPKPCFPTGWRRAICPSAV
jgi:hypothetical protein